MSIKLIAVDMDETFLRTDKTYDVERFKKIYDELKKQDIVFLIASGVSYHQLKERFDDEDKETLYFAGDNGSFIVKKDEVIGSKGMSRDLYLEIIDHIQSQGKIGMYVSTGMQSYILKDDETYDTAKIYNHILNKIDHFSDIPEDIAYKNALINDSSLDENKKLADNINDEFEEIFSVTSGNIYIDILNKESGKGYAIQYLQNKYNITPEETMIFGDSMNDHSMIPYAKYNISMSNADPEFAKDTDYTIGSNNEQAVLDILEQFLEDHTLEFMEEYKN